MRKSKKDTVTGAKIEGDRAIGELIRKLIILYSMTINPHGQFEPLLMRFFLGTMPKEKMTFDCTRSNVLPCPNAEEMYRHLIISPCPSGVLITTTVNWKQNKTAPFFGGTHTAPTPTTHTMQQLGLTAMKDFGLLLRQGCSKHMGIKPRKYTAATGNAQPDLPPPASLCPIVESQQVTFD